MLMGLGLDKVHHSQWNILRSLWSFTWVSWGYLPSTDISCRPHFCYFLPSLLCCYLFSKCNIHFFILVFSDPTLFSLSFPVSYFLCLLLSTFLLCLSLHMLYLLSLCLSCLPFTFFFATLYLSPLTFFLCLPPNFSFCFYLSLSSTFFLCFILLPFFACLLFHSLTLLFILLHTCVCVLLLLLLSFLSSCSYFLYFLPIF